MATKSDHIIKYIKEILLPVAREDGFQLYKPKELLRVKGPFIDRIAFQLGQYGSKSFYVHFHKNLVSFPALNMNSYSVGHRLSNNSDNGDETDWQGSVDDDAKKAITSVSEAYVKTIRPWFESVNSVAEFVFEYFSQQHDATAKTLEIAVAFAEGKKRNAAWWICSDLLGENLESDKVILDACKEYIAVDEVEKSKEALQDAKYAIYHEAMAEVHVLETNHDSIDSLLIHWRQENIKKLKLEKYVL